MPLPQMRTFVRSGLPKAKFTSDVTFLVFLSAGLELAAPGCLWARMVGLILLCSGGGWEQLPRENKNNSWLRIVSASEHFHTTSAALN